MLSLACDLRWHTLVGLRAGEVLLEPTGTGYDVSVWGAPLGLVRPGEAVVILDERSEMEHVQAILEAGHAVAWAKCLISRLGA